MTFSTEIQQEIPHDDSRMSFMVDTTKSRTMTAEETAAKKKAGFLASLFDIDDMDVDEAEASANVHLSDERTHAKEDFRSKFKKVKRGQSASKDPLVQDQRLAGSYEEVEEDHSPSDTGSPTGGDRAASSGASSGVVAMGVVGGSSSGSPRAGSAAWSHSEELSPVISSKVSGTESPYSGAGGPNAAQISPRVEIDGGP